MFCVSMQRHSEAKGCAANHAGGQQPSEVPHARQDSQLLWLMSRPHTPDSISHFWVSHLAFACSQKVSLGHVQMVSSFKCEARWKA